MNRYGTRDASVRLLKIRGAVQTITKSMGLTTPNPPPSSTMINTALISTLGPSCDTCVIAPL